MAKLPPLPPKLETPEAELQFEEVELDTTTTTSEAAEPAGPPLPLAITEPEESSQTTMNDSKTVKTTRKITQIFLDAIPLPTEDPKEKRPPVVWTIIEFEEPSETNDSSSKTPKNPVKTILFYIFFPIVSLLHCHFRYTELYNFPITNFTFWHILPFHLVFMIFLWDPIFVLILTLYAVISVGLIHRKFSRFVGLSSQNPFRIQRGILYMMGALYVFCISAIGLAFAPELSWLFLLVDLLATPILVYGYFMVDNRFVRFHISLSMDFVGNRGLLTDIALSALFHLVLIGGMVWFAVWKNISIPWIYCTSLLLSSFLISIDYSRVRQKKIYKYQFHSKTREEYEQAVQRGYSWPLSKIDIIKRLERGGC